MSLFDALAKAHGDQRLPHALLLSFAPEARPAFEQGLRQFMAGLMKDDLMESHPDFLWLKPESQTKGYAVEQLEEFFRRVHLRPNRSEWRVFVFDEAEHLSSGQAQVANALLKILEEPQQNTLFVLCSTRPLSVLATIRSRCQHFRYLQVEKAPEPSLDEEWKPLEDWLKASAGIKPIPELPLDADKFWKDRDLAQVTLMELFETLWKRTPLWWPTQLHQQETARWALDFFEDFQELLQQLKFYTNGSLQWASLRQRYL